MVGYRGVRRLRHTGKNQKKAQKKAQNYPTFQSLAIPLISRAPCRKISFGYTRVQKIKFSESIPDGWRTKYAEVGKLHRASGYIGLSRDEIIKNLIRKAVVFIEHSDGFFFFNIQSS